MSNRVSYREESLKDWGVILEKDEKITDSRLQLGAILRIADASEVMAKNHIKLQRDLDYYKRLAEDRAKSNEFLRRSNAALRGHLTRLRSKL